MDDLTMLNKVAIVVVTFNRKKLLKDNIEALMKLDYTNSDIYVIDNSSTDGTKEYIQEYIDNKKLTYINTGKNLGGAGGFNFGIRKVVELGYDYIWIMDDDTIPYKDSLTQLLEADKVLEGNYGFLSSSVLWTNGEPCKMNKQKIEKKWYDNSEKLKYGIIRTYYATFVSFFIKAEIVKKLGLPIKDFFIWGDDVEYTDRISKVYPCYIVGKSQVEHRISNNEGSNIAKDSKERINRYKYAYRNEVYIAKRNGIRGMTRQFLKICLHIYRVLTQSKDNKIKKINIIIISSIKGLFFNPKVEYVEEKNG